MNRLKITLILVALVLIFGLFMNLFLSSLGVFNEVNILISDLKICSQNIILRTDADTFCDRVFPQGIKTLYICGVIDSIDLIPNKTVELSIYLHYADQKKAIFSNLGGDLFGKGNFCRKMEIPEEFPKELFTVNILRFRNLIASTIFEIR